MKRAILTLSGLQLAATCPGAAVLPRIGSTGTKADIGSALHEYNATKGEHGKHAADAQADGIAERWGLEGKDRASFFARARTLDLQIPEGALFEQPLCLLEDGSVVPTEGARGEYHVPDGAIVAGTVDVLFATPEQIQDAQWCPRESVLWAADLKTGDDAFVPPIARNWQARVSALLGARWTGAEAVVPAIVFPSAGGGTWDVPTMHGRPVPLLQTDLDAIERDLRKLHTTVLVQAERLAEGKTPKLVTGTHCTYCPARAGCPAHVAEARALVAGETGLTIGPLTHEQAVKAVGLLGPARKALESMEQAVKAHVEAFGPIQLADGRVYGPHETTEQEFDPLATYNAVVAELTPAVGIEDAKQLAANILRVTKGAIYDVITEAHERVGIRRQKKQAFDRVAATHGVSTMRPAVRWAAQYPKK